MNVLLSGVGGQGTVLASRLIAQCAIDKGINAKTAETIGMAQRGGCVVSHVRTGDTHSPLIPFHSADLIIGFEPGEAARVLPYLAPGGAVVTAKRVILPVSASLTKSEYKSDEMLEFLKTATDKLTVIDGDKICKECGSPKVLNIALVGAAISSGSLNITIEDMEKAIKKMVHERFWEQNLRALKLGARLL